jgi:single-strand DNA-binding protein
MSINVFTFSGRLGRDAETRHTAGGKSVTGFPVAVDVGYGDNKHPLWVDCAMWAERGEKLAPYLLKGSVVTVTGEADLNIYKAGDGAERTKLVCRVNDVQLPPRASGESAPAQHQERAPEPSRDASYGDRASGGFQDDEIPFAPIQRRAYW